MSGPRVTTGDAGMQDGSTPVEFIKAVEGRWGGITLDLAAHRLNRKHARYFAPKAFKVVLKRDKVHDLDFDGLARQLADRGADYFNAQLVLDQGRRALGWGAEERRKDRVEVFVENHDKDALALDALRQDWARAMRMMGMPGLGWLNCEWADVEPWVRKTREEVERGARVLLLTHVAIADWARDLVFGQADVSLLSGRLSFDGKNVLPKDCMLSYFHPEQSGKLEVWDWRRSDISHAWMKVRP